MSLQKGSITLCKKKKKVFNPAESLAILISRKAWWGNRLIADDSTTRQIILGLLGTSIVTEHLVIMQMLWVTLNNAKTRLQLIIKGAN